MLNSSYLKGYDCKFVFVGDSGVGKTAIVRQYARDSFPTNHNPTVTEEYETFLVVDEKDVTLQVCDVSGLDDYVDMRKLIYTAADVIIVVYDLNDVISFEEVEKKWARELFANGDRGCPVILAANKTDLKSKAISIKDKKRLSKEIGAHAHIQCSAKSNQGLERLFQHATRVAFRRKENPDKFRKQWDKARKLYMKKLKKEKVKKRSRIVQRKKKLKQSRKQKRIDALKKSKKEEKKAKKKSGGGSFFSFRKKSKSSEKKKEKKTSTTTSKKDTKSNKNRSRKSSAKKEKAKLEAKKKEEDQQPPKEEDVKKTEKVVKSTSKEEEKESQQKEDDNEVLFKGIADEIDDDDLALLGGEFDLDSSSTSDSSDSESEEKEVSDDEEEDDDNDIECVFDFLDDGEEEEENDEIKEEEEEEDGSINFQDMMTKVVQMKALFLKEYNEITENIAMKLQSTMENADKEKLKEVTKKFVEDQQNANNEHIQRLKDIHSWIDKN